MNTIAKFGLSGARKLFLAIILQLYVLYETVIKHVN